MRSRRLALALVAATSALPNGARADSVAGRTAKDASRSEARTERRQAASGHMPAVAARGDGAPATSAAPPPSSPLTHTAEVVERVVAVVDDRPLFLSDVRALAAVRGLAGEEAIEAAVDERLMHVEASRLAEAEVRLEEEDRALLMLLEARPHLRGALPEPDLRRLLRRQAAILKYVEFRFRPQVRVSDEEVRRAWEAEDTGRAGGVALEDAQDALRGRLERRALDERIEAWVKDLRARASVRRVGSEPAS